MATNQAGPESMLRASIAPQGVQERKGWGWAGAGVRVAVWALQGSMFRASIASTRHECGSCKHVPWPIVQSERATLA